MASAIPQPFISHVHELRTRLLVTSGVAILGAGVGYFARDTLLTWLQSPLNGTLYFTDITGAFNYVMLVCLLVGLLAAIPVLIYNVVAFMRPALPRPVSRFTIIRLSLISQFLALSGAAFAYYASLPLVLHFLTNFDSSHLHPLIAASSYLSFVVAYLAVFAIAFQLPLFFLFIDRITPIPPSALRRARKWVIIGAFGVAFILPIFPDPLSQLMLAAPVVVLYELSIGLMVLTHRYHARRQTTLSSLLPEIEVHPTSPPIRKSSPPPRHRTVSVANEPFLRPRSPIIDLRRYPGTHS